MAHCATCRCPVPHDRLTPSAVALIRECAPMFGLRTLADTFGVSTSTVHRIINGTSHRASRSQANGTQPVPPPLCVSESGRPDSEAHEFSPVTAGASNNRTVFPRTRSSGSAAPASTSMDELCAGSLGRSFRLALSTSSIGADANPRRIA